MAKREKDVHIKSAYKTLANLPMNFPVKGKKHTFVP